VSLFTSNGLGLVSSGLGLGLKNLVLITSVVSCAPDQVQTVAAFQRSAC